MKKIHYKVIKTLVLVALVGGISGIVLADPPVDPAHPKKTHERSATTTTATTTTTTHVAQSATTTHVAPAAPAPRPEDHPRTVEARPDVHDNDRDHHFDNDRDDHHFDNDRDDHHFDHDRRDVHYEHDNRGWYDEDHHRHDFVVYRGHRGYWNYENGQPVFVSIDVPLPFSINIHL